MLGGWLRGSTPLGIRNQIQTRGIFPPAHDHKGGGSTMDEVTAVCAATEAQGNYLSVQENEEAVASELTKER